MPNKFKNLFESRKALNENINPTENLDEYLFEEFYVDTWYNKPFYGKVDTKGNAVIPREQRLKFATFATDPKQVQALDFVADLFKDVKKEYETNYKRGNLSKRSRFFKEALSPTDGFTTSRSLYLQKLKSIYSLFLDHIINNGLINKINNYSVFLEELKLFIYNNSYYYTRVGFVESREFSPLQTGLILDVYSGNPSDSAIKEEFYKDVNYPAFLELCLKHGFIINKEIPWRVTCDIRQKLVAEKIESLNKTSKIKISADDLKNNVQKLFDVYYDRVIPVEEKDYDYFKEFMISVETFYKSFVFQFPTYKRFDINNCGNANTISIKKENIPTFKDSSEMHKFYIKLYFEMRRIEIRDNVNDQNLEYYTSVALSRFDDLYKDNFKKATCEAINLFNNSVSTLPYRERSLKQGGPISGQAWRIN